MKNWKVMSFKLYCLVSKSLKGFSWLRLLEKKQCVLNFYWTQSWQSLLYLPFRSRKDRLFPLPRSIRERKSGEPSRLWLCPLNFQTALSWCRCKLGQSASYSAYTLSWDEICTSVRGALHLTWCLQHLTHEVRQNFRSVVLIKAVPYSAFTFYNLDQSVATEGDHRNVYSRNCSRSKEKDQLSAPGHPYRGKWRTCRISPFHYTHTLVRKMLLSHWEAEPCTKKVLEATSSHT